MWFRSSQPVSVLIFSVVPIFSADYLLRNWNTLSPKSEEPDKTSGTIKEQLAAIAPALEQLWKQKEERIKELIDVQSQIQKICGEIAGSNQQSESLTVDESDLSFKKLLEFHDQLKDLQKEKVQIHPQPLNLL